MNAAASNVRERLSLIQVVFLMGLLVLTFAVPLFVFKMYYIPSGSMESTLQEGDYVIASPFTHPATDIKRSEIVVFFIPKEWKEKEPGTLYAKRVIGIGGDTVESAGGGAPIIVNGLPVDESSYLKPGVNPSDSAFKFIVPEGHLFVLGDNRPESLDSRFHPEQPFIAQGSVQNKIVAQIWPLTRAKILPDYTSE